MINLIAKILLILNIIPFNVYGEEIVIANGNIYQSIGNPNVNNILDFGTIILRNNSQPVSISIDSENGNIYTKENNVVNLMGNHSRGHLTYSVDPNFTDKLVANIDNSSFFCGSSLITFIPNFVQVASTGQETAYFGGTIIIPTGFSDYGSCTGDITYNISYP